MVRVQYNIISNDIKLMPTVAATVACSGYQALAFPPTGSLTIRAVAEPKDTVRASKLPRFANNDPINSFNIRDGRLTRSILGEVSKAALVSLRKRAPFSNFNVKFILAEASVSHGLNTTLCIFNPCKSKHPVSFCWARLITPSSRRNVPHMPPVTSVKIAQKLLLR